MSDKPNAVEVEHLAKRFGDFTAVDDVTFHIPVGEIFGLLGPNGAGKTTIIRMLCGILLPTSGQAWVMGFDITRQPEEVKRRIGYMSQKFSLYSDLTVIENLDFYAHIYELPAAKRKQRMSELIEMAGLRGREKELIANLSGAWRQRLALACAIVHEPPMLFLDEPTAGVNPVSRREFWNMIYDLAARDVSVLATTHYMDEAEYCNMIGMMYNSRLIALDEPDALKVSIPGTLLEIECDAPDRAEAAARRFPGVVNAALHGILLHVTVEDAALAAPLQQALEQERVVIQRIEAVLPSLEDTFVSLVEAQDRAHQ